MKSLRPSRHRARVVEAVAEIARATVRRRVQAMPRWADKLGTSLPLTALPYPAHPATNSANPIDRQVARAIKSASRLLPYKPRCLDEATAGQSMLRRRHQPGAVVIGLKTREKEAHAWLITQGGYVTGAGPALEFAAASCFLPVEMSPRAGVDRIPT